MSKIKLERRDDPVRGIEFGRLEVGTLFQHKRHFPMVKTDTPGIAVNVCSGETIRLSAETVVELLDGTLRYNVTPKDGIGFTHETGMADHVHRGVEPRD